MLSKRTVLISFLLAFTLWLVGYLAFSVSALSTRAQKATETTDAIVVLTGGNHRIKTGLELFASGRARHLFVTGVNTQVTKREITAMWDGDTALPPCCISIGHEATTTKQNAQETRNWILENRYTSLRLVTSGYHMSRAAMEFRHAIPGIRIIKNPVPYKDYSPKEKRFWTLTFSEYNKTILRAAQLALTPKKKMVRAAKE